MCYNKLSTGDHLKKTNYLLRTLSVSWLILTLMSCTPSMMPRVQHLALRHQHFLGSLIRAHNLGHPHSFDDAQRLQRHVKRTRQLLGRAPYLIERARIDPSNEALYHRARTALGRAGIAHRELVLLVSDLERRHARNP